MLLPLNDEHFMKLALAEARQADDANEVPVGAVIVHQDKVIARGHNQKERLHDPTAHAEMLAITAACEYRNDWRLTGCSMYVTLEPCVMCAGAILLARLDRLAYGTADPKTGACGSMHQLVTDPRANHQVSVTSGLLELECSLIVRNFFARQRNLGKKG